MAAAAISPRAKVNTFRYLELIGTIEMIDS